MVKDNSRDTKAILKATFDTCPFKVRQYLYTINYTVYEEALCKMEMKYLFNKIPSSKYLLSNHYIKPIRSAFIKQCISVIYSGNTIGDIIMQIKENCLSFDNFKVCFIDIKDDHLSFKERRETEYEVGYYINGNAKIHEPEILLGLTRIKGKWLFGSLEENKSEWKIHNQKPFSYCNAIDVKTARALINIAVAGNLEAKLIDPCCGIGTVIMEALSLDIDIEGFELNPLIAKNAKENLRYFGYRQVITNGDMHNIHKKYDTAIVDLPYGVFSLTTLEEQKQIIETSRRLASRVLFVTYDNMDDIITSKGFTILDKCTISKNNFTRYLIICR